MSKLTEEQLNEISKTVQDKLFEKTSNPMVQVYIETTLDTIIEFMKEYQKQAD